LRAPGVVGPSRTTSRLLETSLVKLPTLFPSFRMDSGIINRRTPAAPPSLQNASTDEVSSFVPPCFPRLCQAFGFTASLHVAGEGEGRHLRGMADFKAFLRCRVRIISLPFPGCDDLFFHGFCSPSRSLRWGRRHTLRASVLPLSRCSLGSAGLPFQGPLRCADLPRSDPGCVLTLIRLNA